MFFNSVLTYTSLFSGMFTLTVMIVFFVFFCCFAAATICSFPPWERIDCRYISWLSHGGKSCRLGINPSKLTMLTQLLPLCCHYCHFGATRNILIIRQYCSSDGKMKEKNICHLSLAYKHGAMHSRVSTVLLVKMSWLCGTFA